MTTQRRPSEVLTCLASSVPAETFLNLLAKNVYPALDCLPETQCFEIVSVLEAIDRDHQEVVERIALIGYDDKRDSLQKQLKALKKHVQRDWRGSDIQSEIMEGIAGDIVDWLPSLWTVGVEDGLEITLIHKCLSLCYEIVDKVYDCGSRAEFADVEIVPIIVKNNPGKEVYTQKNGSLFTAIAWLWRELLVSSLVNSPDDSQAKVIIDDIEQVGFLRDVEGQLREGGATETPDGYGFHDEHWSEKMQEAADCLRKQLASKRITEFENNPTFNTYRSLLSASPALKESLLDKARSYFFREKGVDVPWTQAVAIFKAAGSSDDMVRAIESVGSIYSPLPSVTTAKRDAVSYLMVQSDEYRMKARLYLENGIADAQKILWSEIEDVFPGIDEAYEYLDEKLESQQLTKRKDSSQDPLDFDRQRNDILDAFVKMARNGSYAYDRNSDDEDYEYEQDMEGVDEDDSDYDDVREAIQPDIAGAIRGWLSILDKWPNTAEAEEIRSNLKEGDDDLFYAVDGVADVLADRCDWSWNHSSAKVHVAEGIRAAYVAFGPDAPIKGRNEPVVVIDWQENADAS